MGLRPTPRPLALRGRLRGTSLSAPMIAVSHLTRRFGALTAVDDISFELQKGEVVGFLGVNGAGKSTTMRMLTGFLPATQGSIAVAGHDVLRESLKVRASIGYLPEGVPLYGEHRVEEMLRFQGRLHGLSRGRSKQRCGEVLERVGLLDRRRTLIGRLSKGQRQRVGLAVALLPDPPVLILDEPTSGLDPLQRLQVRRLVGDLAEDRTVLLSSHILPEIESVCPRVIVLHRGRVVADGTHAQLAKSHGAESFVLLKVLLPAVEDAAEDAREALARIDGVQSVQIQEQDDPGQVHCFRMGVDRNPCAAVGALAQEGGWTVHELSFHAPTLEGLFARLAVGDERLLVSNGEPHSNGEEALEPEGEAAR